MIHPFKSLLIAAIFCSTIEAAAQPSANTDSLKISKIVTDFFGWYMGAIQQHKSAAFQPIFAERKDGMTTLDFSEYFQNLTQYGFSDSLLFKEKASYQRCIDELEKVKYSDFKAQFTDLEDFENIECDFGNYYRWTGGQEPIGGIRIQTVRLNNSFSATVAIEYFDYDSESEANIYWGRNVLTMRKVNGLWKIDDVHWK